MIRRKRKGSPRGPKACRKGIASVRPAQLVVDSR